MLADLPDIALRRICYFTNTSDKPNLRIALGDKKIEVSKSMTYKENFHCLPCQLELLCEFFRLEDHDSDPNDPNFSPSVQRSLLMKLTFDENHRIKWTNRGFNYSDQKEANCILLHLYSTLYQCFNTTDISELRAHTISCHGHSEHLPPNSEPVMVMKQLLVNINNPNFGQIMNKMFCYMENLQHHGDYIEPVFTKFMVAPHTSVEMKIMEGKCLRMLAMFIDCYMDPNNWNGNTTTRQMIHAPMGLFAVFKTICNVTNGNWKIHGTYDISKFEKGRSQKKVPRKRQKAKRAKKL